MRAKGAQDVYFQLFWDRLARRDVFMYEFRLSQLEMRGFVDTVTSQASFCLTVTSGFNGFDETKYLVLTLFLILASLSLRASTLCPNPAFPNFSYG